MAYLQFHGRQYPVPAEGLTVGCYDGAALRLPGDDASARAVLTLAADGSAVIRRDSSDAVISVNGVRLGVEPSPILHGDKLEMAGEELRFGDVKQGGSTQFVSGAQIAEMARAKAGVPAKPTLARGGRLVSLTDGREYVVLDDGITIGREVGNDIVIPSTEVSRKHAEIVPMPGGYELTDLSTNGMFVNGARVEQKQVLGRGDVLKIGPEEFRFYADQAKAAPTPPPPLSAAPAPAAAVSSVPATPAAPATPVSPVVPVASAPAAPVAPSAPAAPAPTPAVPPAPSATPAPSAPPKAPEVRLDLASAIASAAELVAPPPAPAPVAVPPPKPAPAGHTPLATLEIIAEGPLKGTKFEIHSALTNVGRGAHNDVVVTDESVSDSHAKIQKRDNGWFIVDQESTNGTYVGGRRVQGEQRVEGAPDLRFGGIKMTFRPLVAAGDETGGTRAIAAMTVDQARKSTMAKPAAAAAPPAETKMKGCGATIAFFMVAAAAGASMLMVLLSTGR